MQFGEKSNDYENNARSEDGEEKKGEGAEKSNPIKRVISFFKSKLSEKGEREVRQRLEKIVRFLAVAAVAYLLGGSEIYFGVYPLALSLICSSGRHLPAVTVGLGLALLSGMPPLYGYLCLAILFARVLIVLVPMITSERFSSRSKERGVAPPSKARSITFSDSAMNRPFSGSSLFLS